MEIIEKLKNRLGKKNGEMLVEYGAEKVQNTFEQIEGEEAYDEAAKTAIEEIKKHPELALEILATINEKISSKVAVNTVIQLPEEEEFSEKTAVKVTEQLDLEDKHKVTIIEESNLEYQNKMEIAKQLEDKEIRDKIQQELKEQEEQRSLEELKQIYNMCNEDTNELTLEKQLNEVMKNIHIDTESIQKERNRIIAKKIAFNYARFGTNIVSKQRNLMTPKEMCEMNIVQIAKEEYKKILSKYQTIKGDKIKEFNEQELNYNILNEIEATALTDGFNEEATFKEVRSMMKTLMFEERKELLIKLKEEIKNKRTRETYQDMKKSGIVDTLADFSEKERKKILEIFKNVIDKRRAMSQHLKVAESTPKIKEYKFNRTDPNNSEERD